MKSLSLEPGSATADVWAVGVKRLQACCPSPPQGFAFDRWALACVDCARLLESYGGEMRRLGWSTVQPPLSGPGKMLVKHDSWRLM